jgi:outer membrane protein TolC
MTLAGGAAAQDARPVLGVPPITLSLDSALGIALPASEVVGIAKAAVERAKGDAKKSRSDFFPQFTGSLGYVRTLKSQFSQTGTAPSGTQPPTTSCGQFIPDPSQPIGVRVDSLEAKMNCLSRLDPFGFLANLPFGRTNQYNLGLQASWLLFAGGRVRNQSRTADANLRAANIQLTAEEARLTLEVTQRYYDAALADKLLEISRGTLELTDSTLSQAKLARQVGTTPEFDVLRAQVARDNQQSVVIQREAARRLAFLRLSQLLDLPLDQDVMLTTAVEDSVLPRLAAFDSLHPMPGDTVTAHRAPVRQAVEAVHAQEGTLGVAKAERWPTVTLTSNYSQLGYPHDVVPSWSDFVTDWNVGLAVKVPLFTGGRIKGNVMSASAGVEDSRLRLKQTAELAAVDTRNAFEELRAALATWLANKGTVEQAERAYTIAEIRYREGVSIQTELADSRLALAAARVNRATAARDYLIARVRVALLSDLPISTP